MWCGDYNHLEGEVLFGKSLARRPFKFGAELSLNTKSDVFVDEKRRSLEWNEESYSSSHQHLVEIIRPSPDIRKRHDFRRGVNVGYRSDEEDRYSNDDKVGGTIHNLACADEVAAVLALRSNCIPFFHDRRRSPHINNIRGVLTCGTGPSSWT